VSCLSNPWLKSLVATICLCWSAPGMTDAADWSKPNTPYRVMGNIFYVGTKGIGVYLITTAKGAILLDGATEAGAAIVEANIQALGFKLTDIKYLIATHAHFDHVGGTAKLKADTGATLLSSPGDRASFESGMHDGDNVYGIGRFPKVRVDRVIRDGERLTLGGVTLTAHATPGHSRGCTTWTTDVAEKGQPRKRRIVFYGSTTVAGNILVNNKRYPTIVPDYRQSFRRLKAMRADVFLTNHPEFADLDRKRAAQQAGDQNAFIDPGEIGRFVTQAEADFNTELAAQIAAAAKP
jgi:metallo-beta-lactamase class B